MTPDEWMNWRVRVLIFIPVAGETIQVGGSQGLQPDVRSLD